MSSRRRCAVRTVVERPQLPRVARFSPADLAGRLKLLSYRLAVNGRRSKRVVSRVFLAFGLGLLGLGFVTAVIAARMPAPNITAVRVDATARAALSTSACENGSALPVTFEWHGHSAVEANPAPDCGHDYVPGEHLTLFVASNSSSNVGPTSDWILKPDEHDPFDFIGPNGLRGFIWTIGAVSILAGSALLLMGWRRSRRLAV